MEDYLSLILLAFFLLAAVLSPLLKALASFGARKRAEDRRRPAVRGSPGEGGFEAENRRPPASGFEGSGPEQLEPAPRPAARGPLPPPEIVVLGEKGEEKVLPPKSVFAGDRALQGAADRLSASWSPSAPEPLDTAFKPLAAGALAAGSPAAQRSAPASARPKRLRPLPSDRPSLREAFVLSEILAPPLALRETRAGSRI